MMTARSIGTQTEESKTDTAKAVFRDLLGVSKQENTDITDTFYQRELPNTLARFSSPEGKRLFRQAMDEGYAEGFFPLTGNFTTQSEPAYCGPSSLAMVLNALEVDPKRRWKGNWRWYSDEFLHCCTSKEQVKKNGITFDNFACLAKCHANVEVNRAFDFTFEDFKKDVERVTSSSDKFMVISFSRPSLDQTGDGHFSPIGAYNAQEGKVLILDTARYKYPSYWCPIEKLFESMNPIDKETGRPRGYFVLSYDVEHPPIRICDTNKNQPVSDQNEDAKNLTTADNSKLNWSALAKSFCHQIPEDLWMEKPRSLEHVVQLVLRNIPNEYTAILANQSLDSFNTSSPQRAQAYINELVYDTTRSPLYSIVMDALYPERENKSYNHADLNAVFATLFVLGSPRMLYTSLPRELQDRIDDCRRDDNMTAVVNQEVSRISQEVMDLTSTFCTCGPGSNLPDCKISTGNTNETLLKTKCCKSK